MVMERITITIDSELLTRVKETAGKGNLSNYICNSLKESLMDNKKDAQRTIVKALLHIATKERKQYNKEHPDNPI